MQKSNSNKKEAKEIGIKPLGDKVLIQTKAEKGGEQKNSFGLIIPDTVSKEKPEQGKVVAIGEGRLTDEGMLVPMRVKVGDTVLFSRYGFEEVKVGDQEYLIVSESSILAIIK
jgi:chaperonin GroES